MLWSNLPGPDLRLRWTRACGKGTERGIAGDRTLFGLARRQAQAWSDVTSVSESALYHPVAVFKSQGWGQETISKAELRRISAWYIHRSVNNTAQLSGSEISKRCTHCDKSPTFCSDGVKAPIRRQQIAIRVLMDRNASGRAAHLLS